MLDPADYDDVMVMLAHPWGDVEVSLAAWIQVGPGPRPVVMISRASRRDGSLVRLEEILLRCRNAAESRGLQRLGLLQARWASPATRPGD